MLQTNLFRSILQTCYPILEVDWAVLLSYFPPYKFNITDNLIGLTGQQPQCSFDPGQPALSRPLMDMVASNESGRDPAALGRGCVNLQAQAHWDHATWSQGCRICFVSICFPGMDLPTECHAAIALFLVQKSRL